MKNYLFLTISLVCLIIFISCTESTNPQPDSASIAFDIRFAENIAKQEISADSVHVKIFKNSVIYKELDLTIEDSTATGTVTLEFDTYDFKIGRAHV